MKIQKKIPFDIVKFENGESVYTEETEVKDLQEIKGLAPMLYSEELQEAWRPDGMKYDVPSRKDLYHYEDY